jgi:hypothetical protein
VGEITDISLDFNNQIAMMRENVVKAPLNKKETPWIYIARRVLVCITVSGFLVTAMHFQ